jgi:hypothetical protein
MNGKAPLYLTLLGSTLLITAVLVFQPYSVTSPWSAYTAPAQRYLQAAMRRDSAALVQQSISAAPVEWGLKAARLYPDSLAVWAREAQVWTGGRWADTAEVLLSTPTDVCSRHPIWLRFVGTGDRAKVVRAWSACFDRR